MTTMHGFDLIREEQLPELNTRARLFRHAATGAELLSLENDDENKVFGISFRTPPSDDTGVAHILEHVVLAGSRKYPLKEPFVELLKGSLQTFLNAFTYPDKTCYPVASQNLQDFYNLIDVYLDAVFHPSLHERTFQQEGWHYEIDDAEQPLAYKGIVYNEMKGAYSAPDRMLGDYAIRSLFPDTTYGVESGGDPRHIPNLTYTQFRDFHHRFYHPSNSRIYFYGDDPAEERLRIVDAYLREFEPLEVDSQVALQSRFEAPRRVEHTFAAGEDASADKGFLSVNWMLNEIGDVDTTLGLFILSEILIGMPASPLRKALIDSGLGEDLAGNGYMDELRQTVFSTGLKGMQVGQADEVEGLILTTLRALAEQGIDPATIEAALNTVEFRLRELNTGSYPRGLVVMLNALGPWLHGGDPLAPLQFSAPLAKIRERVARGERYFEGLIARYFIDNPHRTTLILRPDPRQGERETADERRRLDEARAAMSAEQVEQIVAQTAEIKRWQETPDAPEALATIPQLTVADLPRENKVIPLEVIERGPGKVLFHDLATNGIAYLDVGLDLRLLPQEQLAYVPIFARALLETGAGAEDFVQLSQRIGAKTGGLNPETFTTAVRDSGAGAAWLFLRGKAMPSQIDDLLGILGDVLQSAHLDNRERMRQIVLEEKAGVEAGLAPGGHRIIAAWLAAQLDEAAWAGGQMSGIHYLFFLRDLARQIDADWPAVQATLERIRDTLLNRDAMLCNVTVDAGNFETLAPRLDAFLDGLPATPAARATWSRMSEQHNQALTIPAQINFVGKGANLYTGGYRRHGSALVINKYLSTTWLWEQVRVKGGAYGGFSRFDQRSGVFSYVSYRDPNLLATIDVYDRSPDFLRNAQLDDAELGRAIVGTIGDVDTYQLPDAKGFTSMARYLAGESDEQRQQTREEILGTTRQDFRRFAEVLDYVKQNGLIAVLGSEAAVLAVNAERPDFFEVRRVLPE